ncbi:hypothetical protein Ctob_008916 [Chrysochromulina tobinii]|uniref:PIH1D1/2/3 CS-like domain-containing protein n=1 Tax=Chrysochromulina tobinii TaxID=1460289 RepID=A0A0M0K339_9EUKA|nr:hypothetical protein Ctob_008916 [Chrysochromulina tobinii]|eukprot:KOO33230.1 hypothetical protein Ctob_008916 [Chrysochromulina sp. CCMP291]
MPTPPQHSVTVSDDSVCVRVELPLVNKAGEVDLNISPERLHLIVGDVELDMALPHKVKDEEAAAKFDKKAHVLTLTMPRASVPSVISDSVDAKFEPRRLAMTFRSEPISGAAPHTHKLELQLAGTVNVDGCRC